MTVQETDDRPILVVGGTGKTGRRVAERLQAHGFRTRCVSRGSNTPFDWEDATTWPGALEGVRAAYITYAPDLAMPGAAEHIGAFTTLAVHQGVRRVVLLSGRGEEGAVASEEALKASGADWTVLRASWFAQNFSEAFLLGAVLSGQVALPAAPIPEPFTDADDIAEVALTTLTEPGHSHKTYERAGPQALTFTEAVAEVAHAAGRTIRYTQVAPEVYRASLENQAVPADLQAFLLYLFTTVLDGRNTSPQNGIREVLGREPSSFRSYAQRTAATGVWNA